MRLAQAAWLCVALVAGGVTVGLVRAQVQAPISSIELTYTATLPPNTIQMVLYSDARAEWSSTSQPRVGAYVGQAYAYQWISLVHFLEVIQFSELERTYGDPGDDVPEMVVTVHRGAESESFTDYGNMGPTRLWAVRMVMRGIADTITWTPVPKEAGK
jgi:hypothetical protein